MKIIKYGCLIKLGFEVEKVNKKKCQIQNDIIFYV